MLGLSGQEVVEMALKAGGTFLYDLSIQTSCCGWVPFCSLSHHLFPLLFWNVLLSPPTPALSFPYKRPTIHHLVQFTYVRDEENETPNYHVTCQGFGAVYWQGQGKGSGIFWTSSTGEIPKTLSWIKTYKELFHSSSWDYLALCRICQTVEK